MHLSALGCLLTGGAEMVAGDLTGLLQAALAGAESVHIDAAAPLPVPVTGLIARGDSAPLHEAPVYTARFARDWSIGSFSALVRDLAGAQTAPSPRHLLADAAVQEELLAEAGDEPGTDDVDATDRSAGLRAEPFAAAAPATTVVARRSPLTLPVVGQSGMLDLWPDDAAAAATSTANAPASAPAYLTASAPTSAPTSAPGNAAGNALATAPDPEDAPWHAFARGAYAGNFLHELLEGLAEHRFALAGDERLQQLLRRRCERQGWGHRADEVLAWLLALIDTPLPPLGVPLSGLGTLLPEMEFWLDVPHAAQARHIDLLCRHHLLGGRDRPALPERELRGMLMGFADLVFESGGRYWVLDYKSNALGSSDADYHADALQAAMAQHRYDVQAALYLLALHRLLRLRLGDAYDPARQLGGAVYLFMRGLRGPEAGCVLVEPDPALLDALDRLMAGPATSTEVDDDPSDMGAFAADEPSAQRAGKGEVS
jgi:exodeoxyribonuclease V beta subunit